MFSLRPVHNQPQLIHAGPTETAAIETNILETPLNKFSSLLFLQNHYELEIKRR